MDINHENVYFSLNFLLQEKGLNPFYKIKFFIFPNFVFGESTLFTLWELFCISLNNVSYGPILIKSVWREKTGRICSYLELIIWVLLITARKEKEKENSLGAWCFTSIMLNVNVSSKKQLWFSTHWWLFTNSTITFLACKSNHFWTGLLQPTKFNNSEAYDILKMWEEKNVAQEKNLWRTERSSKSNISKNNLMASHISHVQGIDHMLAP